MRQLRSAMREPELTGADAGFGAGAGLADDAPPADFAEPLPEALPPLPDAEPLPEAEPLAEGAAAPGRARSEPSPGGVGPGFWACWGEALPFMGPVPSCGSGSAEALPSLLKRPCTSVATSGPGVPPRERTNTVSASWKAP